MIIIAIKDPLIENKSKLIDFCLKNKIKVKTVPSVEEWLDEELSANQIKNIHIDDLLGRKAIKLPKNNILECIKNLKNMKVIL